MSKIDVDFYVGSNPYHLFMTDISEWGVIADSPSIVEITLPGSDKCIVKYWDKGKVNVANSNTLNLTCPTCTDANKVTLHDGIYKIVVKGSPETYSRTRYYLKTDLLDMEVDKLILSYPKYYKDVDFSKKLTEIEALIRGAEANVRFDNLRLAGLAFQAAQEAVERLGNCKGCK